MPDRAVMTLILSGPSLRREDEADKFVVANGLVRQANELTIEFVGERSRRRRQRGRLPRRQSDRPPWQ